MVIDKIFSVVERDFRKDKESDFYSFRNDENENLKEVIETILDENNVEEYSITYETVADFVSCEYGFVTFAFIDENHRLQHEFFKWKD